MTEQRVCEQTVVNAATNAKAQIFTNKVARGVCNAWMRLSARGRTSLVMTAAATGYAPPRLSSRWLRLDSRHEHLLAVLDLQNDCSLDRVAVFVELIGAGDA